MKFATLYLLSAIAVFAQTPAVGPAPDAGRKIFENTCARCHGGDANGGEMGPPIRSRLRERDDQSLGQLIRTGLPSRGMPPTRLSDADMPQLITYLRTFQRRRGERPLESRKVQLKGGGTLEGLVLGEGFYDLQIRDAADKKIHLLRKVAGTDTYREVTSDTNWPTYNGETGGNRFTTLTEINKQNVGQLAPKWVFTVPNAGRLQLTPVVVNGIMYVTAPNTIYALDAGSGRQLWHFQVPRQPGLTTGGSSNRGVGVAGDRVFLETDNAHIVAVNRFTGEQAVELGNRRLAPELLRHLGSAPSRRSGHHRSRRWRARSQWSPGRLRSGDGKGSLALSHRAAEGRTRL